MPRRGGCSTRTGRRSSSPVLTRSSAGVGPAFYRMRTRAVFFDVDFTLIYPGPTFRGEGYQVFCARYGMDVDPSRFAHAVASAAPLLDAPEDTKYDDEIYVAYTRRIIEHMGGTGPTVDP